MFYRLFFWVFFGIPFIGILLVALFSEQNLSNDLEMGKKSSASQIQKTQHLKKINKEISEISIDSFFRYEVLNFVAKSSNYTSSPPEGFTKKLIDQATKMYPNSNHLKQHFVSQGIDYYFHKHPYIYEVKIKEIDLGEMDNNMFLLSLNLFRDFDKNEIKAILSEELEHFAKKTKAQVIDGSAMVEGENIKFDGANTLFYIREIDKVIDTKEFTTFKINKEPKGILFFPTFEDIICQKGPDGLLYFTGKTNLPEGFHLSIWLPQTWDMSNFQVKNGLFISKGFKKDEFKSNSCEVEISSPCTHLQPASVRAVIGEKGQNLEGPNVELYAMFMYKGVKFNTIVKIDLD